MRILSSDGSIEDRRQRWHCVRSVPRHLLAHVVDHCKPAKQTLTSNRFYKRRINIIFDTWSTSHQYQKRGIKKAFCRKTELEAKMIGGSVLAHGPRSAEDKLADCLLSLKAHLTPLGWKSSCCSLEESFSITVLTIGLFHPQNFRQKRTSEGTFSFFPLSPYMHQCALAAFF